MSSFAARIAIALAALKYKPRDQSTASYLLDLQARFSVASKDNDGREWRSYALELEKQLATLKTQRDADQELLSKLRTDASQTTSTSDVPPPKKRSKKNPTRDQHDLELNWDQSRSDWSQLLSSQCPVSPSLVAVYASLRGVLVTSHIDLLLYASRLADAMLRALDTMHVFLLSPPCPVPDKQTQTTIGQPLDLKPGHVDSKRIALISPLLMYVLRIALPALVSTVQDSTKSKRQRQQKHVTTAGYNDAYMHLDRVVDRMLECIFLPLLRAFVPLCSARLSPLLTAPSLKKGKDKAGKSVGKGKDADNRSSSVSTSVSVNPASKTDVRTDAFALIGASFEALDTLPPIHITRSVDPSVGVSSSIANGIRDRLGLETIRELESLYAVPPVPQTLANSTHPFSGQPVGDTPSDSSPPLPTPMPTLLSAQSRCSQSRLPPVRQPQQAATTGSRAKQLEKLAGTRPERVRALAMRDAGWFLASTLNLCVVSSAPAEGHHPEGGRRTQGTSELLREALVDRIGRLVRSVPTVPNGYASDNTEQGQPPLRSNEQGRHGQVNNQANAKAGYPNLFIDPVCQNMLLAICERALCRLAP